MMENFCENSYWLKVIIYFRKNADHQCLTWFYIRISNLVSFAIIVGQKTLENLSAGTEFNPLMPGGNKKVTDT